MKKILSLVLALLFLFILPGLSLAEETESFDPAAVAEGMLKNVNVPLENNVTVLESDTPGLYSVYYQAADLGCYLTVSGSEGENAGRGTVNVSDIFYYDAGTTEVYLTFFLAVSAAAEQYVTGETFDTAVSALSAALNAAMKSESCSAGYEAAGCSVLVTVEAGSGMILLECTLTA